MLIQVIIRLIVYIDQAIVKQSFSSTRRGIDSMVIIYFILGIAHQLQQIYIFCVNFYEFLQPWACEAVYFFLEYARTAMFMWMFVEGLYLHNMLTLTVFKENAYHWCYYFIGWGLPACVSVIWMVTMVRHYKKRYVLFFKQNQIQNISSEYCIKFTGIFLNLTSIFCQQ